MTFAVGFASFSTSAVSIAVFAGQGRFVVAIPQFIGAFPLAIQYKWAFDVEWFSYQQTRQNGVLSIMDNTSMIALSKDTASVGVE